MKTFHFVVIREFNRLLKIFLSLIFCILFLTTSYTQNRYSKNNISTQTVEELKENLIKAEKLKRTGIVMLISGPICSALGFYIAAEATGGAYINDTQFAIGALMGIGGIGGFISSIPITIVGASRVKRINSFLSVSNDKFGFDIKPAVKYSFITHSYQPTVAIRIIF